MGEKKSILVTGATGYIASRLIPRLLDMGYRVRCLARNPHHLRYRAWFPNVEVMQGDVMVPSTLPPALDGVHTAYYLIHNMTSGKGYTSRERSGAGTFVEAAAQAGLEHIIYLGGLADQSREISYHMRSRMDTGETLRANTVPVTEFRAGVIVGPGSISFEMIRFMTELMPVILGPVWLQNMAQPIAVQNVIDFLLAALEKPAKQNQIFEIGCSDVMSYADLMLTYGRLRGLRRKYIVVPGIPLWFMALGVEWMTPVSAVIATPLVDGMRSESVVQNETARHKFPTIQLVNYEKAVHDALSQLHPARIEHAWKGSKQPVQTMKHEGFFIDYRWINVNATPEKVFQVISNMGGKKSWPYANWLWTLRGLLDKLVGGPGLRGRDDKLAINCVLDYYRVDALIDGELLRLKSELKAPGDGWMDWRVELDGVTTKLSQTVYFAPRGFWSFVYWYVLNPFHKLIFRGLISKIANRSEV